MLQLRSLSFTVAIRLSRLRQISGRPGRSECHARLLADITGMCSSAVCGAGAPKPTCLQGRRQGRTISVLDGHWCWPVLNR
jgi:hypothetical protein